MVDLQLLFGARPLGMLTIRPCEVDTSGDVCLQQPRGHRMGHLDRGKVIVLGLRTQEVLRP